MNIEVKPTVSFDVRRSPNLPTRPRVTWDMFHPMFTAFSQLSQVSQLLYKREYLPLGMSATVSSREPDPSLYPQKIVGRLGETHLSLITIIIWNLPTTSPNWLFSGETIPWDDQIPLAPPRPDARAQSRALRPVRVPSLRERPVRARLWRTIIYGHDI